MAFALAKDSNNNIIISRVTFTSSINTYTGLGAKFNYNDFEFS